MEGGNNKKANGKSSEAWGDHEPLEFAMVSDTMRVVPHNNHEKVWIRGRNFTKNWIAITLLCSERTIVGWSEKHRLLTFV